MEDYGLPIDGGSSFRVALKEFMKEPNNVTWDQLAHKIIPKAMARTVWQAWIAVDQYAPRSLPGVPDGEEATADKQWAGRFPDVFTLRKAIEDASGGELWILKELRQ